MFVQNDVICCATCTHGDNTHCLLPSFIPVKTRNVGQCPTWWSPCRTQVAPSVQCRKVWL